MKNFIKYLYNSKVILSFLLPVFVIVIWQILYDTSLLPISQSSSPKLIASTIINSFKNESLLNLIETSLLRLILGVAIGVVLGIILAVLLTINETLKKIISPTLHFLSGIPVVVWIPFWIMVFGIGESFKIGLIAISTFFLVFGSAFQSMLSIDNKYLDLGRLYKKKTSETISKIILPYSLYSIYGSIRLSFMIGWIVLFFVEYSISYEGKEGLGWFIANARSVGRIDEEFAGLITLGLIAYIFDLTINYFQKKAIKWKK